MTRKKWALLIVLIGLGICAYVKLFYKTFSEKVVAKSADNIVAIDVKRITNTAIWSVLTHTSKWKMPSFSSEKTDKIDWKDIVEIPDYVFAFHAKAQPANAWYTMLEIKNENDFEKAATQYQFVKDTTGAYINKEFGIQFVKKESKILVTTAAVSLDDINKIAKEIFVDKAYCTKEHIETVINKNSHIAFKVAKNNFLAEDAYGTITIKDDEINIDGNFIPQKQFAFTNAQFSCSDSSLCSIGFAQPNTAVYALLSDSAKASISKAINIDFENLIQPSNKYYNLDIAGFKNRTDSAITYTYDDDFNKIEKVVVNNVEEPAYKISVFGDSVSKIYNNWFLNKKIERTNKGDLFTPLPFAKSYCNNSKPNELTIATENYLASSKSKNIESVFYFNLLVKNIPASLLKYLPTNMSDGLGKIKNLEAVFKSEEKNIHFFVNAYSLNSFL
jgi:hypothetical protein